MNIHFRVDPITIQLLDCAQFQEIINSLTSLHRKVDSLIMTDLELTDLLNKVDATTNAIGANLTTVASTQMGQADVIQTISDEIDKLIKAQAGTIGAANAKALQSLADRLQVSSDISDKVAASIKAQVPVLNAIATKGAPVVPPPPPPPPPVPPPPAVPPGPAVPPEPKP